MEHSFFKQNPELLTKKKILVAVSTGVDSMVLLHLMQTKDLSIGVIHIDHQLRKESKEEADFLEDYCQKKRLPFYKKIWETPSFVNVEAKARTMRYAFFEKIMEEENYDCLVTAHHADDQLETMLMRFTRGGSLRGHAGIMRCQSFGTGQLIRPLLSFSKNAIYAYAEEKGLSFFEDKTNASDDYARNRIRHHVSPRLKEENPQVLEHAQQFHAQLVWADEVIERALNENLKNIKETSQASTFEEKDLPKEQSARYYFLYYFFRKVEKTYGFVVSQKQLFLLMEQIGKKMSQWTMDLGQGYQFVRSYQIFSFERAKEVLTESFEMESNQKITTEDGSIFILRGAHETTGNENNEGYLQLPIPVQASLPLTIRHRKAGDRIQLSDSLKKRVNRYFIDKKISADQRDSAWIVADSKGEILAVLPFVNSYLSIGVETDKIHYILEYIIRK